MFQKLEAVENRYEELNKKIADPEVIANTSEWTKFMKEHAEIEEVALKYKEYKQVQQSIEEAQEMLNVKSELELVETRQHYLLELYTECIQCMQKENTGK